MSFLALHLAASLTGFFLILAVFAWPKGQGAHRLLGRLAAVALLVSAVSSFGVQARGHLSALHVLSVVVLLNVPYGIWAIRTGRIAAHKRAMLGSASGLVIAGLFAVFAPGPVLHGWLFG